MGNYVSGRRTSDVAGGKVILSDGTVHIFNRPTAVAELMLEHPQQFVIEFRSLLAGTKPALLPADHKLDPERVYLMLPMKRGKAPTLSAGEARQVLSRTRSILLSGSSSRSSSSAWSIKRIRRRQAPGPGRRGRKEEKPDKVDLPAELPSEVFGEMPEFLSRQLSSKGWKPTLHTIEERGLERKLRHWLL